MYRLVIILAIFNFVEPVPHGHFGWPPPNDHHHHHEHDFGSGPDSDEGSDSDEGPDSGEGPEHGPGHEFGPGHGCHHHTSIDNEMFEHISNKVIGLEEMIKRHCTQDQEIVIKEVYEQNIYKLKTTLPNFTESRIEVKIRNKVLYIKAVRESDSKQHTYVRILPGFLDMITAKWHYVNDELTVAIRFKIITREETVLNCDNDTDRTVTNVPMSDYDLNWSIDVDERRLY